MHSFLLVTLVALGLGLAVAISPWLALLAFALPIASLAYVSLARRIGMLPALLLPVLLAGLLVPKPVTAAAEILLATLAVAWLLAGRQRTITRMAAILALTVVAYWVLQAHAPNVPTLAVGMEGVRKTALVFIGLSLGLVWSRRDSRAVEHSLVWLLCIAGGAALLVHLAMPEIEASFSRSADSSSEMFAGQRRMAGFFAGPFHVALLGAFLAIWGWHLYLGRERGRLTPVIYMATGALLLFFAEVRSGYIAVILGIVVTLMLGSTRNRSRFTMAAMTVLALALIGVAIYSSPISNAAISSISELSSDPRALNRVTSWEHAWDLVWSSPFTGWGAGAAGATLGPSFLAGEHVTTHNMALGFLVEGGVVGFALVCLVFACLWRASHGFLSVTHPAAAAAIVLFTFALSGNVSEALPVSLCLMILTGLRIREGDSSPPTR